MDRKLTEKEKDFLLELRELMSKYSVLLYSEDDKVCMEVGYSGEDDREPIVLPLRISVFFDLDEFIEQNS